MGHAERVKRGGSGHAVGSSAHAGARDRGARHRSAAPRPELSAGMDLAEWAIAERGVRPAHHRLVVGSRTPLPAEQTASRRLLRRTIGGPAAPPVPTAHRVRARSTSMPIAGEVIPGALSDLELLALLIGRGRAGPRHRRVARRLLTGSSLGELAALAPGRVAEELAPAPATVLALSLELGRRAFAPPAGPRTLVQAADVHAVARDLELAQREHFVAFLLDARNRVLARETISVGTLSASLVHPREVFGPAIERRAAAIIVVHNHPSGDPEPSADDLALTRRLVQAGILVGIEVLDHLVIGHGTYVSLKSRGLM